MRNYLQKRAATSWSMEMRDPGHPVTREGHEWLHDPYANVNLPPTVIASKAAGMRDNVRDGDDLRRIKSRIDHHIPIYSGYFPVKLWNC